MIDLKAVLIAELDRLPLQIFASHDEALAHLCDHVLTRPESHYWSVLIPGYRDVVQSTDDRELDNVADALWRREQLDVAQRLYDGYAHEITLTLCLAASRQWHWQEFRGGRTRSFGIGAGGVTVIWRNQIVVSAMLEPYAAPPPNRSVSHSDRATDSRPRRATWEAKRGKLFALQPANTEKTRYELFRKSFSSVRRRYWTALNEGNVNDDPSQSLGMPIPSLDEWQRISSDASSQLGEVEQRS